MRAQDAIRRMCEESDKGTKEASLAMGRARSYLSATLSWGNVSRADTLAQIAQACGYRLILENYTDRIQIDPE